MKKKIQKMIFNYVTWKWSRMCHKRQIAAWQQRQIMADIGYIPTPQAEIWL